MRKPNPWLNIIAGLAIWVFLFAILIHTTGWQFVAGLVAGCALGFVVCSLLVAFRR